jgi:subtilisin family serine protease
MARSLRASLLPASSRTRRLLVGGLVLGTLALTACSPVASPAPATPVAAPLSACSAPVVTAVGKTQYFAVVDDGTGANEAVTFDAASVAEQQADVATIEATVGDVVAVEVDQVVSASVGTNSDEPMYVGSAPFGAAQAQWGLNQATFPEAWANVPSDGAGVKVAVLDSGVQATHPDLAGAVVAGSDRVVAGGDGTNDQNGHGTHVAGIIGARDQGIGGIGGAPMTTIMTVRVLGPTGTGDLSQLINGINFAVANGANVISMSLGGPNGSASLEFTVATAIAAGVVVVAAAGNNGSCVADYPAGYPGVISVGATDQGVDTLAAYSQRGPDVDIAAPGTNVWSDYLGSTYLSMSGTSMATPFVSAAAALVVAKCPGITPAQVETRLESTAQPIPGSPIQTSSPSGALRAGAATAVPC